MSGGDDMPDPTEVTGPMNPAAEVDYLVKAAEHLGYAESAYAVWLDPRATGQDRTDARATVTAAGRLAELNIRMATACGAYQDRQPRVEVKQPDWLAPAQPYRLAKTPDEVATEIREQVQADAEAHQAETLRPRADPEPEAEGELWTPADHPKSGEWFAYATNAELGTARWLIIESYAGYLRWRDDASLGVANEPVTWPHLGDNTRAVFRRPTAAERAAFYGPEPDPIADTHIICPKCGAPGRALEPGERERRTPENDPWCPPCTVPTSPARQDRTPISDGTLQALTDAKLEEIRQAVKRETTRRAYDPAPQPSGFDQSPRPRGGAAQWREG